MNRLSYGITVPLKSHLYWKRHSWIKLINWLYYFFFFFLILIIKKTILFYPYCKVSRSNFTNTSAPPKKQAPSKETPTREYRVKNSFEGTLSQSRPWFRAAGKIHTVAKSPPRLVIPGRYRRTVPPPSAYSFLIVCRRNRGVMIKRFWQHSTHTTYTILAGSCCSSILTSFQYRGIIVSPVDGDYGVSGKAMQQRI